MIAGNLPMNVVLFPLFGSMKIRSRAETLRLFAATWGPLTTRSLLAVRFALSSVPDRSFIDELSLNGCRYTDFTHSPQVRSMTAIWNAFIHCGEE
jgi:hypothetical protein